MSLEYRSGRWNVIYWPQGRKAARVRLPVPAHIQERGEARKFHDEALATIRNLRSRELHPRPMTGLIISRLWDEYLPWYQMHRAATTYTDVKNIGKWVKKYIGKFFAEEISAHHIELYKQIRTKEAGRPINRTINKEIAYIKGFVAWAGRNGHITPRQLHIVSLPYNRPVPQILSVDEVQRILQVSQPFYRVYIACLYVLGLRSVEARNMTWDKIDWQNSTIQMIQKGGKTKPLPVGSSLLSALREIAQQRPYRKTNEPVFLNPQTGKAIKDIRSAIRRAFD